MRRELMAMVLLALAGGTVAEAVERLERRPPGPEGKAARRQWAMARMDEMANERMRCRDRFTRPREVEACEADFTRRYREYDEIYLEAARE